MSWEVLLGPHVFVQSDCRGISDLRCVAALLHHRESKAASYHSSFGRCQRQHWIVGLLAILLARLDFNVCPLPRTASLLYWTYLVPRLSVLNVPSIPRLSMQALPRTASFCGSGTALPHASGSATTAALVNTIILFVWHRDFRMMRHEIFLPVGLCSSIDER